MQIVPEHQHEPDLYALLLRAWRHLNDPAKPASEALLALFELRALQVSGFLPELADLPGLPPEAIPTLESWLGGRWEPLEAKLVRSVQDVDLGLIYGIGFPPFKGGLLHWADTLGAKQILELLKPLDELGERYQPTQLLEEMAAEEKKF